MVRKIIQRIFRSIGWLGVSIIVALLLVYYVLQLPSFQTLMAHRASTWLSEQLGADVQVGQVKINWFDDATFEDVAVKDLKGREMIRIAELYVNYKTNFTLNTKQLIAYDRSLDYVMLNEPTFTLVREADGNFNFDHWLARIETRFASDTTLPPTPNYPFTIDAADVQKGTFTIIDSTEKRFPRNEFDYFNFSLNDIQGNVKQFTIFGDTLQFEASNVKAIDRRSQLRVKDLRTQFFYSRQQMLLKNLYAHINESVVQDFLGFYYNEPRDFAHFNQRVKLKANFRNSRLDAQDLGRFAPDMYAYKELYLLTGQLDGTVDNFAVKNLDLKFGQESFLKGDVAFKGLPAWRTTHYVFNLKPSLLTANDARQYGGEANFKYVQPFEKVNFDGKFEGLFTNFTATGNVVSSGLGTAKGTLRMTIRDGGQTSYFADVETDNLALGKITNQPELLNILSFAGKIEGQGTTIPTANLRLDGTVKQLDFRQYSYRNMRVEGNMRGSVFTGHIAANDPNLQGSLDGTVDFNPAENVFKVEGNLQHANLQALGLAKFDARIRTNFNLDFQGNKLDNWLGAAKFTNTVVSDGQKQLPIKTLSFYSLLDTQQERLLQVDSEFLQAAAQGNFVPTVVLKDMLQLVEEYLLYFENTEAERTAYYNALPKQGRKLPYRMAYEVSFRDAKPLFAYFAPAVAVAPATHLNGTLEVADIARFTLKATSDSVAFGKATFYGSQVDYVSTKDFHSPLVTASLAVRSETQQLGKLRTEQALLTGNWEDVNFIQFATSIRQQTSSNSVAVKGQLSLLPDGFDVILDANQSVFSVLGEEWKLTQGNRIFVEKNAIYLEDLEVFHLNKRLSLEGKIAKNPQDKATLTIENFNLKSLQPLLEYELSGLTNGTISLTDFYDKSLITSNLTIDNLIVEQHLVGSIASLLAWDATKEVLDMNATINRNDRNVATIKGTYDPNNTQSPMKAVAELRQFTLASLEGFVKDIFSDLGGVAYGDLTIEGKLQKPRLRGKILIDDGRLRLNTLNSYLYFDDVIHCTQQGFVAGDDGFVVRDAPTTTARKALIRGGVYFDDVTDYRLGLEATIIDREGFLVMNTTLNNNEYFYGKAFVEGNVSLVGSLSDVVVTGNLTSKRGTKLTIPLDGATTVDTQEEAVPFLNKQREVVIVNAAADSTLKLPSINLSGLRMNFNIRMTPEAECEIIFDRNTNDRLLARGNGRLTVEYDTRGGLSLTGPFEVQTGKYDFSFQNLASVRKFDIQQGSRIEWAGNPYEAQIDLQAIYTANISLKELLGNTSGNDIAIRYPAEVQVKLTDRLMQPTVAFGLDFKMEQMPITLQSTVLAFEQRLRNDEQLLNRNVTSVLLSNQLFPTDNVGASLTQQFFLDNFSNLLSNQLGNLANKLNPNLEFGFQLGDVRQSFNNMQLNVAYQYNERLRVKGNSFYANGGLAASSATLQPHVMLGGEIEYLLTNDGTWRLRAYSRSVPNSTYLFPTSAGNVVVYGMNLQFSRNFNQLFPRRKDFPKGVKPAAPDSLQSVSQLN